MAGSLNFIPITSGYYSTGAPSADIGNDEDYCLDLNTNTLYGPKNSSSSYPWPTATRVSQKMIWQGSWGYPASYAPGDVVSYSGQKYLCIKPQVIFPATVTSSTTGPWTAGTFVVYNSALYLCYIDTNSNPSVGGIGGGGWYASYNPSQDAALIAYGAGGTWIPITGGGLDVDSTVSVGNPTNFILATGGVQDFHLANNSVTNNAIASNAVTNAKILDLNVTDAKLSSTGVTAGTYPKVTVTSKGRVTSGSSLAAGDLPSHASSHYLLGGDPITIDATYQITTGTVPLARLSNIGYSQLSLAATSTANLSSSNAAVDGSGVFAFKSVAANATAATTDHVIYTATSSITITLHSGLVATVPAGKILRIKNNAAAAITVKTASGEYINATNYSVTGYSLAAGGVLNLCTTGASSAGANNWITL